MLFNLDGEEMNRLPHQEEFDMRRDRLPDGFFERLWEFINQYCDANREVRAGYFFSVPEFAPLHQELVAALGSEDEANLFLGQVLWEVVRARPDRWRFHRPEGSGGGDHPVGMVYWRED